MDMDIMLLEALLGSCNVAVNEKLEALDVDLSRRVWNHHCHRHF
jgi:hypothetical protein